MIEKVFERQYKVQPLFNFTGTISEKIKSTFGFVSRIYRGNEVLWIYICDNVAELGLSTAI
jgi:hypothetical protein